MQYTLASVELWKRRARMGVLGIGALALVSAVAMTVPLLDRDGAIASAVAKAVADPASILSARSPGERPAGALTQSKKKKRVASGGHKRPGGGGPKERVLSQIRERPGALFPDADLPFGEPFPDVAIPPQLLASNLPVVPVIPGVPVIGFNPGDGFVPGPGGGTDPGGGVIGDPGNGGQNPGGGGDNPPPPPVAGVPEPGTWATFILGFLFVGVAIRRRRSRAAPAAN